MPNLGECERHHERSFVFRDGNLKQDKTFWSENWTGTEKCVTLPAVAYRRKGELCSGSSHFLFLG